MSTWWTLSLLEKAEAGEPVLQRQADRFRPARARLGLCGDPGVHLMKRFDGHADRGRFWPLSPSRPTDLFRHRKLLRRHSFL